jgi:tetratricopeptide (TPR) repeat protein
MTIDSSEDARIPGNIVFIQVPEDMAREIGSFKVDPAIMLPVELGDGGLDLSGLGWEMIVAGMLRLLAHNPGHEAAGYYRRFVLAVKPGIFPELSETGILKARNGDHDVAEEIFLALCGLAPEAPEPILNLAILNEDRAELMEQSGKEDLAEAIRAKVHASYQRLLRMEPAYPEAFFNAAFFYLKGRIYDRALELFESYLALGQDEARLAKAREISDKLRTRGDMDALFKEAYDFIRMGDEETGIAKAREFLAREPSVWNGWFLVGWGSRRLGRWEEGREAFLKVLDAGIEEVDTLNELAICEMELGMLSESRKHLERALRMEPENVKIISNLGIVARKQGNDAEAAGFFRTVLEFDPGDQLAGRQLAEMEAES